MKTALQDMSSAVATWHPEQNRYTPLLVARIDDLKLKLATSASEIEASEGEMCCVRASPIRRHWWKCVGIYETVAEFVKTYKVENRPSVSVDSQLYDLDHRRVRQLQVRRKRWAAARKVRQSQVKKEQTARKQFQKTTKQEQRARLANATDGSGSGGGGGSSRPEGKLDVAFSDVVDELNLAKIEAKGGLKPERYECDHADGGEEKGALPLSQAEVDRMMAQEAEKDCAEADLKHRKIEVRGGLEFERYEKGPLPLSQAEVDRMMAQEAEKHCAEDELTNRKLEAKSANKKGFLSAARADAAAEAWVTAHVLAKIFGDGVASEIASCFGWMILDDRWTAPDGRGGWLQLGALNDECNFGGWDSTRWLWKHGWVVEESSMSDWSFMKLHSARQSVEPAQELPAGWASSSTSPGPIIPAATEQPPLSETEGDEYDDEDDAEVDPGIPWGGMVPVIAAIEPDSTTSSSGTPVEDDVLRDLETWAMEAAARAEALRAGDRDGNSENL